MNQRVLESYVAIERGKGWIVLATPLPGAHWREFKDGGWWTCHSLNVNSIARVSAGQAVRLVGRFTYDNWDDMSAAEQAIEAALGHRRPGVPVTEIA